MNKRREIRPAFVAFAAFGAVVAVLDLAGRPSSADASPFGDPYEAYRSRTSVSLPVTQRDFTDKHVDFAGTPATAGKGRYAMIAADTLDPSGKPAFNSTGFKVNEDWMDAAGTPLIPPRSYIAGSATDIAGSMSATAGGAVKNADSFAQWFRTDKKVNTEHRSAVNLAWNGSAYAFNGSLDSVNGKSDFNYTAAIDTTFIAEPDKNWYIDIDTDAEVFVYIDNRLVIDGGGGLGAKTTDVGLPGGHFDVDVYNTTKKLYHKHQFDDSLNVTHIDLVNQAPLLLNTVIPKNHPNLLRVKLLNKDNGGWGTYTFQSGKDAAVTDYIYNDLNKTFKAGDLKQLRFDFKTLGLMAHTSPGTVSKDWTNRGGSFAVRIEDTVTGKILYEVTAYHHGTAPANYASLRTSYNNRDPITFKEVTGNGMPQMSQRIDLSRLPWLNDGKTHSIQVFYANRTGLPTQFSFETNINTLGLAALPPPIAAID